MIPKLLNTNHIRNDDRCISISNSTKLNSNFVENFQLFIFVCFQLDEEEAEECEKFSSCAYYSINVLDFETGLHYNLERVLVILNYSLFLHYRKNLLNPTFILFFGSSLFKDENYVCLTQCLPNKHFFLLGLITKLLQSSQL